MNPSNPSWELRILGFWQLRRDDCTLVVGVRQQRVIAALAVLGRQPRRALAAVLWPESTETRAAGSLRVSLFHICHDLPGLLVEHSDVVGIADRVDVDLPRIRERLAALVDADAGFDGDICATQLRAELLPGWYEDWVLLEQEQWRAERIAALESLAQRHLAQRRLLSALTEVRMAIALDPLRENARSLLVRILLVGGDRANALQASRAYRAELFDALGIAPSSAFQALISAEIPRDMPRGRRPGPPPGTRSGAGLLHAVTPR